MPSRSFFFVCSHLFSCQIELSDSSGDTHWHTIDRHGLHYMSLPAAMLSRNEHSAYSVAEFNSLHLEVFSKACGQMYFDRPHLIGKMKDGRQQVHIKKKTFIPLQLTAVMLTFKTKPMCIRALPSFITVSRHICSL